MKKMAGTRLELPATPKLLGTSGICNPHNYGDCGDLLLATDVGICVGPYITTIVYYGASDPLLYVYVYIYIYIVHWKKRFLVEKHQHYHGGCRSGYKIMFEYDGWKWNLHFRFSIWL